MIEIKNLSYKKGSLQILDNINFTVNKGEVVAIIGPSGSGKSSLLRCINHLEMPSKGEIYIEGKKITKKNDRILTKKMGMVFQGFNLFPHMNVTENLTYAAIHVNKITPAKALLLAKEKLELVKLSDKSMSMPNNLSGGQKQRVAIARALMMQPQVILFDEPTSALDPEGVSGILHVIDELRAGGITIIIVTHHLQFAQKACDRIIFINRGLILEDASVDQFFSAPKSQRVRLFLQETM